MRDLDSEGVEMRKRKYLKRRSYFARGPNWSWHLDGYDKLKPYGFNIHEAIDGYSRRILWLEVCRSNKHPKTVCSFYVNCLKELQILPIKIIADKGTENVYIAASQKFLRRMHTDSNVGFESFKYYYY